MNTEMSKSTLIDRTAETRAELKRLGETIQGLADEIRVQLHLGTMELRERWKKLEPRVIEAEAYVDAVGETIHEAMLERVRLARELREHLAAIKASRAVARK